MNSIRRPRPFGGAIRSRAWNSFGAALGLIVAFTGASGLISGEASFGESAFALVLMTLPGVAVAVRAPMIRVTLTDQGLAYHGFFRNRWVNWASVASIEISPMKDHVLLQPFAPVVWTHEGEAIALSGLAGYRGGAGSRVERQARQIAEYWRRVRPFE